MVERVARALEPEAFADDHPYTLADRADAMRAARRAIEAMREPTDGMVSAGVLEAQGHDPRFYDRNDSVADTYAAMIDAALKDPPSS
jgi:hypothetical protein